MVVENRKLPLLSIVITCYNYEDYVVEAIQSVLDQNANWIEVIVIDDGSTDRSWERISEFSDSVLTIRKPNGGPLESALLGFANSRGGFIYFLDADDLSRQGSLKIIEPYLQKGIAKIQFQLTPIDKQGRTIGPSFPVLDERLKAHDLIESINKKGFYSTPPTSGNVFRRDLYENLGDLSYERAIDGVAYLFAPYIGEVISINQPLGYYRIHGSNITAFSSSHPDKIRGYRNRFIGRLRHLDQLLRTRNICSSGINVRDDYSYVLETLAMETVASGSRPSLKIIFSYLRSVSNEYNGWSRWLRYLLIIGLSSFPSRGRKMILEFRVNPAKYKKVRSFLKKILTVR